MIRIFLTLAGVAVFFWAAWLWLMTFAAGMSDNPQEAADETAGLVGLFGLPVLAIALFVLAWWVGR